MGALAGGFFNTSLFTVLVMAAAVTGLVVVCQRLWLRHRRRRSPEPYPAAEGLDSPHGERHYLPSSPGAVADQQPAQGVRAILPTTQPAIYAARGLVKQHAASSSGERTSLAKTAQLTKRREVSGACIPSDEGAQR